MRLNIIFVNDVNSIVLTICEQVPHLRFVLAPVQVENQLLLVEHVIHVVRAGSFLGLVSKIH